MRKLLVALGCLVLSGCGQSTPPPVVATNPDECRFLTQEQATTIFGSETRLDLHAQSKIANVYTGYDCAYAVDKVFDPDRRLIGYELKLARDLAQAEKLYLAAEQKLRLNPEGPITLADDVADRAFISGPKPLAADGRREKSTAKLYIRQGNSFLIVTYTYPQAVDNNPAAILKQSAALILAKISA